MPDEAIYTPLAEGHIRLLSLEWPAEDDHPLGSLIDVSLNENPSYEALSYAWGENEASIPFSCDGRILRVTPNLNAALHRLVSRGASRILWIDQICINQGDNKERRDDGEKSEKSVQVAMMHDIYQTAKNVIVWLGEGSGDIEQAVQAIPDIEEALANAGGGIMLLSKANFAHWGLPELDSPIWAALYKILSSPWFERLWTLQEVVLAQRIEILYGKTFIDWDLLCSFTKAIVNASMSHFLRGETQRQKDLADGISAILHVQNLRNLFSRKEQLFFPILLETSRTKLCTKDVDRVYGVLGLLNESHRRHITVDYKLPTLEVYLDISKFVIRTDPSLYLLFCACTRSDMPGLPSWCPNFSRNSKSHALGTVASRAGYWAGFRNLADLRTGLTIRPGSNSILAPGFKMDIVSEVVPADWPGWPNEAEATKAKQAITWEKACRLLSQKVCDSPNAVPEKHWRTLIANKFHTQWPCTSDMRNEYLAMLMWLEKVANYDGFAPMTSDTSIDGNLYIRMNAYVDALNMAVRGRSYFSTDGRRTGIGPSNTRVGDLVCVLMSGPTPYILRPDYSDASGSSYTLVGESYVDGLMSSEALDLHDLGWISEETFIIN